MATPTRPDHEIHALYKGRMKLQVIAVLWLAFLLYAVVLLPDPFSSSLKELVNQYVLLGVRVLGGSALGPILAFVFFSSDNAFNGKGKTAKWTRSILPSVECARDTGFEEKQARTLWFRYFDTWALPGSPNQTILQNTYSATYTGRMVYHLTRACSLLFALSIVTVAINNWVFHQYETIKDVWPHLLVIAIYGGGWLWLYCNNQIGGDGSEPTGAWKRIDDVFGRSVVLLQTEVLKGVTSFDEAMGRVEELRKRYSASPTASNTAA